MEAQPLLHPGCQGARAVAPLADNGCAVADHLHNVTRGPYGDLRP
jgi:hypothetical protein